LAQTILFQAILLGFQGKRIPNHCQYEGLR